MKKTTMAILAMTIGLCFITGTLWAAEKEMPRSGFLHDYSTLTSDDPMKVVDWVYIKEDTDWKSYNKMMLDDVVFFIAEDADYKGFEAKELADLGTAFHQAFIMNLAGAFEFTDKPGPGVMRLRLAVTNLKEPETQQLLHRYGNNHCPSGLAVKPCKKSCHRLPHWNGQCRC